MSLNALQRETILEWIDERSDAFTIEELAVHFDVHYQTAWRWIKDLEDGALVEKAPLRRNGKNQYVRSSDTNAATASQRALKIQRGKETLGLAEFAVRAMSSDHMQYVGAGLCYLITRSYYAEEPEYQHLRGTLTTVDVRSVITQRLREIQKDLEAVHQLLQYRTPFTEGSELARRAGTLPVGVGMSDVIRIAQEFSRNMLPDQAELAAEVASQSPPVPPVEEVRTIGEALEDMSEPSLHVIRGDDA